MISPPLTLSKAALPIGTDKKGGRTWGWLAVVVWAHATRCLNFRAIAARGLNQFISGNVRPKRRLGKPHSLAQINRQPFVSPPDTRVMYGPNKINIPWIYFFSVPAGSFNVGSRVPRRPWERSEAAHFNASGRNTRDRNVGANDHLQQAWTRRRGSLCLALEPCMNVLRSTPCRVWKQISKTEASLTIAFQVSTLFNKALK